MQGSNQDPAQSERASTGGEPAMSWTQPVRPNAGQNEGQAQLFETAAPAPPVAAPAPPPSAPPANGPESAANQGAAPAKQVVWSSAPVPDTWHSDARRDE